MRCLKPTFLPLVLGVLAVAARAQLALPRETIDSLDSLDATVADARSVAVGRVVDFPPGTTPGGPYRSRDVTIAVSRTLKGAPESLLHVPLTDPLADLERWKATGTRLLVAVPLEATRGTRAIDLDDPRLLVSTEDFALLRDPEAVVRYATEAARRAGIRRPSDRVGEGGLERPGAPFRPQATRGTIDPPKSAAGSRWRAAFGARGANGLVVPVGPALERFAQGLLRSEASDDRVRGAREIEPFPSKGNVARLRRRLDDPAFVARSDPEASRGVEKRLYPVRDAAYRTLLGWGETVSPPPTLEASVSRLATIETLKVSLPDSVGDGLGWLDGAKGLRSLALSGRRDLTDAEFAAVARQTGLTDLTMRGVGIGDARLAALAGLKDLRTLDLDVNPLTDAGLPTIAALPVLTRVSLGETETTDPGLDALRRARPTLEVLPARATSPIATYIFRGDRAAVARVLDRTPGVLNDPSVSRMGTPLNVAAYDRELEIVRLSSSTAGRRWTVRTEGGRRRCRPRWATFGLRSRWCASLSTEART